MLNELNDRGWTILLGRIQDGKCTPFLGAGVNVGILPLGSEIAQEWAKENQYPLEDASDLVRVAQFLAVDQRDPMFPKEKILRLLKERLKAWSDKVNLPEFMSKPNEPLGVLASLPFPIYMTTNYDDLIVRALKVYGKDPKREFCPWNKSAEQKQKQSIFNTGFEPTPDKPIVFHLHGYEEVPESLVLTEDDYLDFLVNISKRDLLPPRIQEALGGTSLVFVGYRLADWDFRVLFRGVVNSMEPSLRRLSVAVQLLPEGSEQQRQNVQDYLAKYFDNINVQVYWGKAGEFVAQLRNRWRKFITGGNLPNVD